MAFDAEREITSLWRAFHGTQDDGRRFFYLWRQTALQLLGDEADPMEVALKAWENIGIDTAKSYFPRTNLSKPNWLQAIASNFVATWMMRGAKIRMEKGANDNEILLIWDRCPFPTTAKQYGASMEEDVQGCDKGLQTTVEQLALFTNKKLKIETLKAIPRGEGACVRRLWVEE
ncbi:MAG: hypothetical protein BWY79_00512 [Actinobacteria bacterium ADurb.Bin444]|nr:MAG: hypothetical protein BWY79_00512 [Actinobacteria bacterium ADurb.Bin444]